MRVFDVLSTKFTATECARNTKVDYLEFCPMEIWSGNLRAFESQSPKHI